MASMAAARRRTAQQQHKKTPRRKTPKNNNSIDLFDAMESSGRGSRDSSESSVMSQVARTHFDEIREDALAAAQRLYDHIAKYALAACLVPLSVC